MATRLESREGELFHRGPPLLGLAVVHTVLFVGSIVVTAILTSGGHLPSPFDTDAESRRFLTEHSDALRVNAFLQLGAAVVVGVFAATAVSRLWFSGIRAAGTSIALVGGVLASGFGVLSALVQWVIAEVGSGLPDSVLHAFQFLFFAAGGPGTLAGLGLLIGGVSVSAGVAGAIPKWLMWFGVAIGVVAELATLTLVTAGAVYLLPAARMPAFVWMICVGALLPRKGTPQRPGLLEARAALTPAHPR